MAEILDFQGLLRNQQAQAFSGRPPYIPKKRAPFRGREIPSDLYHRWGQWCMLHGIRTDRRSFGGSSKGFSASLSAVMDLFPVDYNRIKELCDWLAGRTPEPEWHRDAIR